jgi:hypothetical protein
MTIAEPAHCKNCHAPLSGRFCVNCGQAANVHVPTTSELMHELLEGLTHSDSRLWRTLKDLWFSPGKLTAEFIAGRRAAYLPPFRLYLIVSIVFFLIESLVPTRIVFVQFDDAPPPAASAPHAKVVTPGAASCDDPDVPSFPGHPIWNQKIKHACLEIVRDNGANLTHAAIGAMPKAMFIFLPLVAFLHMLLYWRPRRRYAEHLLFFVHLHAFIFSVAILLTLAASAADAWPTLKGTASIFKSLLGWSLPVYTVFAMRRVFRSSWGGTLGKGIALFFIYMLVFALTMGGVFVYAAMQL